MAKRQRVVVVKAHGIPFWLVGEFTTHFRTYFNGDWDAHWGYDLDFDSWPNDKRQKQAGPLQEFDGVLLLKVCFLTDGIKGNPTVNQPILGI